MIFKNVKELIAYCKLCPVCNNERNFIINVGPDDPGQSSTDVIKLNEFRLEDEFLILDVDVRILSSKYKITFKINTIDNTFLTTIPQAVPLSSYEEATTGAKKAGMYFAIYSSCESDHASAHSLEMNLDLIKRRITSDIGMDEEGRALFVGENSMFYLEYFYEKDTITLSKCAVEDQNNPVRWGKEITLPMANFDFSNKEKLIFKLKTLMLFS